MASRTFSSLDDGPRKKRKITISTETTDRHITRLMTSDSPQGAVFDTSELLENVLSYLSLRELFVLQKVSQQWRGVIAGSPGLQRKMFLRSQRETTKEIWIMDGYNKVRSNTSYSAYVQLMAVCKFRRVDGSQKTDDGLLPMTLNPTLLLPGILSKSSAIQRVCAGFTDVATICIRPATLHSLLNMYLSDPPCRVVEGALVITFKRPPPLSKPTIATDFHVESDAGVTLGDIFAAALKRGEYIISRFCRGGLLWKGLRTELKEILDQTAERSGWSGNYEVEHITLKIRLLEDGNATPLIVTDEERAAFTTD